MWMLVLGIALLVPICVLIVYIAISFVDEMVNEAPEVLVFFLVIAAAIAGVFLLHKYRAKTAVPPIPVVLPLEMENEQKT